MVQWLPARAVQASPEVTCTVYAKSPWGLHVPSANSTLPLSLPSVPTVPVCVPLPSDTASSHHHQRQRSGQLLLVASACACLFPNTCVFPQRGCKFRHVAPALQSPHVSFQNCSYDTLFRGPASPPAWLVRKPTLPGLFRTVHPIVLPAWFLSLSLSLLKLCFLMLRVR